MALRHLGKKVPFRIASHFFPKEFEQNDYSFSLHFIRLINVCIVLLVRLSKYFYFLHANGCNYV